MPRQVQIPGVGLVDFPDTMSDDEINEASGRLYQESRVPDAHEPEEGFFTSIVKNIADLPRRGLSTMNTFAHLMRSVGSDDGFGVLDLPEEEVEKRRQDIRGFGIDIAAAAAGTVGALAAAPLGIAAVGGSVLSRLLPATLRAGSTALAASPLFARRQTAGKIPERLKETAIETGIGAAFPLAGKALGPLGRGINKMLRPVAKPTGAASAAADFVGDATLKEVEKFSADAMEKTISGLTIKELPLQTTAQKSLSTLEKFMDDAGILFQEERVTMQELGQIKGGTFSEEAIKKWGGLLRSEEQSFVSRNLIKRAQMEAASIQGELDPLLRRYAEEGHLAIRESADGLIGRFKAFQKEYRALRSEAGRSLNQLRRMNESYRNLVKDVEGIGVVQERLPIFQEHWKRIKEQGVGAMFNRTVGKDAIRFWTVNIFPIFSGMRDLFTNFGAAGSRAIQSGSLDVFDFVKGGGQFERLQGHFMAIRNSANAMRQGRSGATPAIDELLSPTALGEKIVPVFGNRVDKAIFFPAFLKKSVDTGFKRWGAMSVLYEKAIQQANKEGLKSGIRRTERIRELVFNAPADIIQKAAERGRVLGFNRKLSKREEAISRSSLMRLFVTPFPRWNFQFTRFMAEHTPLDPVFWGKVLKGVAGPEDLIGFATRNLSAGMGLMATNELLYDNVDFETMEYVREDGERIRLTGLTPLPEALAIVAVIRGDGTNAFHALEAASIPFLGGPGEGIAGKLTTLGHDYHTGVISADTTVKQIASRISDVIPGKGMLGAITQLIDPTIRENALKGTDSYAGTMGGAIVKNLPFLSRFAQERIDPTTGEIARYSVKIPLLPESIAMRKHFPRGFPGGARVTTKVEAELFRLGFGVRRPRRLPYLRVENLGLGPETQLEYERKAGRNVGQILGQLVNFSDWGRLSTEQQRDLMRRGISQARSKAQHEVLGATGIPRYTLKVALETYLNEKKVQRR